MLPFASLNTTELAPLDDVTPVPPLATFNVPPRVIAPVVGLEGVKPVVPPLNETTETPDKVVQVGSPPEIPKT